MRFGVHSSITITFLTASCQKPLQYRLLTCCSRECSYSLGGEGFPSSQAQSMASVKSLVFTILNSDLRLPLFLWLHVREQQNDKGALYSIALFLISLMTRCNFSSRLHRSAAEVVTSVMLMCLCMCETELIRIRDVF